MCYKRLSPVQIERYLQPIKQLLVQHETAEALKRAQFMTKMLPYYAVTWCLLAQIQWQIQAQDEAILSFKRALALEPQNPQIHLQLGQIYQFQGDKFAAIESFETAVRLGSTPVTDIEAQRKSNAISV